MSIKLLVVRCCKSYCVCICLAYASLLSSMSITSASRPFVSGRSKVRAAPAMQIAKRIQRVLSVPMCLDASPKPSAAMIAPHFPQAAERP